MSGSQSYKEIVQLALRVEKLIGERLAWGKFQMRNSFGFMSGQPSKKCISTKYFDNSSGSVSSPQTFRSP